MKPKFEIGQPVIHALGLPDGRPHCLTFGIIKTISAYTPSKPGGAPFIYRFIDDDGPLALNEDKHAERLETEIYPDIQSLCTQLSEWFDTELRRGQMSAKRKSDSQTKGEK